jgi:hypothetical protein
MTDARSFKQSGRLCDPGFKVFGRNNGPRRRNVHRYSVQSLIAITLVVNLSLGMAAAPAVGLMTARGSFTIDDSSIAGNATLFEGNHIETGRISSELQLNNGARMQLAAESRGIVYRDRLVLEKGMGRVENAGNFQVEANTLRIHPGISALAQISLRGSGMVEVAALRGPVRVTASNGVLLASLQAGKTVDFTPEAAAATAGPTVITGCLESSSGKFLLTDEASLVRFELAGAGLDKEVGRRVQVSGTVSPVPDALSKVQSTEVKELAKKCSNRSTAAAAAGVGAAGAGAGAAGAAGGGTIAAIGAAIATHAVIAGVVVAGVAAGAAVAVVKGTGGSRSADTGTISQSTP